MTAATGRGGAPRATARTRYDLKGRMGHATSKSDAEHLSMTDETFTQLRELIYEQTGITFQPNQKYLLESRLLSRLKRHKLGSYQDYYEYLRRDPYRDKELTSLYALITTNETYFYRDIPQLDTFMGTIVPATMEANKASRQLRIWSAACSTGDEVYTLAILLQEHPPLSGWTIDLLGTDLSDVVLEKAMAGVYGAHTLRHVPPALKAKYFAEHKGLFALSSDIKQRVKLMNLNLYDRPRLKLIRGMDVIFCRNCLIYFDDKAKHRILTDLHAALKPSGYLVIGFSESLTHMATLFRPIHAGRSVVYQKV
jgi:chemotaxis protein methyltransferase CheR